MKQYLVLNLQCVTASSCAEQSPNLIKAVLTSNFNELSVTSGSIIFPTKSSRASLDLDASSRSVLETNASILARSDGLSCFTCFKLLNILLSLLLDDVSLSKLRSRSRFLESNSGDLPSLTLLTLRVFDTLFSLGLLLRRTLIFFLNNHKDRFFFMQNKSKKRNNSGILARSRLWVGLLFLHLFRSFAEGQE
jgi:hypothetical protein